MIQRIRASYNPWFIIPFLLWMITGAILLLIFGSPIIFTTVNTHHTAFWDMVMSAATNFGDGQGIVVVLALLMLIPACRNWWFFFAVIVCNVVPALLVQVLKYIFDTPRPLTVYKGADWIHIEQNWHHLYMHSFPSGHSAGVFSMCCFLAMIVPRRLEWMGGLLFLLALFVGYTRMYLAAHFYIDVYVGSIVGTTTTLFCFTLMKRLGNTTFRIGDRKAISNG